MYCLFQERLYIFIRFLFEAESHFNFHSPHYACENNMQKWKLIQGHNPSVCSIGSENYNSYVSVIHEIVDRGKAR